MTERLFIEFAACEGAVVRILGLIERRGFAVKRIAMAEQPDGRHATLALTIEGHDAGRSVATLVLQLRRIHGVSRVTHETAFIIQDKAA